METAIKIQGMRMLKRRCLFPDRRTHTPIPIITTNDAMASTVGFIPARPLPEKKERGDRYAPPSNFSYS